MLQSLPQCTALHLSREIPRKRNISTIKLSFQWQEAIPASGLAVKATTILDVMQKSFQQDMKIHDNHDNGLQDYTLPDAAKFATM
jgi:hypothetical protein